MAGADMPMPPGGPIEIVFSFDTTGSMGSYIAKVRTQVQDIITRLLGDVPFLRIAVFAHGDYCDALNYVTKHVDFSRDVDALCEFVRDVRGTGGGDWEECYELVLREVRTELSWTPGTQRALVMIGDAIPHAAADYARITVPAKCKTPKTNAKKGKQRGKRLLKQQSTFEAIDWKEETRRLHEETGLHIYAVQCGSAPNNRADFFWEHLAEATGGKRLMLDNFEGIVELIMAICYRESGPDVFTAYEHEVRHREGAALRKDLDAMFTHLRDREDPTTPGTSTTTSGTTTLTKADSTTSSIGRPWRRGRKRTSPPCPVIEDDDDDDDPDFMPPDSPTLVGIDMDSDAEANMSDDNEEGDVDDDDDGGKPTKKRKTDITNIVTKAAKGTKAKKPRVKKISAKASATKDFVAKHRNHIKPIRRESKPAKDFEFIDLEWSRWQLAMAKDAGQRGNWHERTQGHIGMRNVGHFEDARDQPAVYELAVQLKERLSKHPVLVRSSEGFQGCCWDTYLLRDIKVRRKIDHIIAQGHKLYVRRALLDLPYVTTICGQKVRANTADELRRLMGAVYDYPWVERKLDDGKRGSRLVKRSGVVISGNCSTLS